MRSRGWVALLLIGTAALDTGRASAGPPYVTDDPEPADAGKWEVYGFGTRTAFRHGSDGESGLDINYGGAKDPQLSAVVSFACQHDDGDRSHTGLADTEIGSKYRFLHQQPGSWMPDVSLFPKILLPTADHRFGSGGPVFEHSATAVDYAVYLALEIHNRRAARFARMRVSQPTGVLIPIVADVATLAEGTARMGLHMISRIDANISASTRLERPRS